MSKRQTIPEAELTLRNSMWTDAEARLWSRKTSGGFITVPKTLPLIARIMDEMSKNFPLSETYIALWSWTWDNAFVRLNRLDDLAYAAGFTGQRGVRTLQDRIKRLERLGFVELRASGNNKMAFAFLPNPHVVLFEHHFNAISPHATAEAKALADGLREASFNAFLGRAQEIGCNDVRQLLDMLAKALATPQKPATAIATGLVPEAPGSGLASIDL